MTPSPGRILCIGECMVELSPTATEGQFAMGFAGDTFNTAWYLRKVFSGDWQVDYLTAIGTDALSDRMAEFMADAGIGTEHVARLSGPTVGLYLINLLNGERSFAYWRSDSAARRLAQERSRLDDAMAGAAVVYVSGITCAILQKQDRARFLYALDQARAAGSMIVFDTNLRPRLWSDPDDMRDVVMQTAARAQIVLPSHDDEAEHFGDADIAATAARYAEAGATLVVVKNGGGDMAVMREGNLTRHAVQPIDKVIDSTAAGDSFNAAFLAAYLTGAALDDALQSGMRLAAHVIGHRGALVAVPSDFKRDAG